jgi:hypothetical protein
MDYSQIKLAKISSKGEQQQEMQERSQNNNFQVVPE